MSATLLDEGRPTTASEKTLQVRSLDADVYRALKIECADKDVTMATLIAAMWKAYQARGRL